MEIFIGKGGFFIGKIAGIKKPDIVARLFQNKSC